jgi:hypothetical protein
MKELKRIDVNSLSEKQKDIRYARLLKILDLSYKIQNLTLTIDLIPKKDVTPNMLEELMTEEMFKINCTMNDLQEDVTTHIRLSGLED